MTYENTDRHWMEQQFDSIAKRLSELDRFQGETGEQARTRKDQMLQMSKDLDELRKTVEESDKKVDDLVNKIGRWEAKLGSFMFIAGCLWAFFIAMKDTIMAFIKGVGG